MKIYLILIIFNLFNAYSAYDDSIKGKNQEDLSLSEKLFKVLFGLVVWTFIISVFIK